MLKVEVESAALRTQPYTNAKGEAATLPFQMGYIFTVDQAGVPDRYPTKIEFIPPRGDRGEPVPYPPGAYQLHPSAVYVNAKGRLSVNMRLTPQKPKAPATV